MEPSPGWIDEVLRFWFEELQPEAWFTKNAQVDETIRTRFLALYRQLEQAVPQNAMVNARGALAAVIVLDQFPRNLFRNSPAAFATDARALSISDAAIRASLDRQLSPQQRHFLYMPFQHSEDRAVQARSVELFAGVGDDALDHARRHKAVIDRFDRFPHRNAVLGRVSSAQETEFLKTNPGF